MRVHSNKVSSAYNRYCAVAAIMLDVTETADQKPLHLKLPVKLLPSSQREGLKDLELI